MENSVYSDQAAPSYIDFWSALKQLLMHVCPNISGKCSSVTRYLE